MQNNNETIASSSESTEKNTQQTDTPEWKTIVGDKYKSESELAKGYKELEKKFGEQSDEVRKAKEFTEQVAPVLEAIRNDPEIFSKLDKKLRGEMDTAAKDNSEKTADNTETRDQVSDLIRLRFEETHGINKLSADEQKELRAKIGNEIFELTGVPYNKVDLRKLGTVLEKAYTLATLGQKSKSEAEDSEDENFNGDGSISSISSVKGKKEGTLTPEQAKVAERLGLTREQYLAGVK